MSFVDKVSYGLGILIGQNLKPQVDVTDIDFEDLKQAIADVLQDNRLAINEREAGQAAQTYLQRMASKMAVNALSKEEEFMKANAEKEGVIKHASGIQYIILKEGNGAIPRPSDSVTAHYEGSLINGKVFDSSIQRGQPATFRVNQLIRGWQEALVSMPAGSKWRLFIPSHLGYGQRGAGGDIPPNATLIFDLELISVNR